ncbi:MAG: hypothetical protein M0P04_09560 [Syntrophales bacterium]|nr:hypothetical protein [Syntrophales bacterium]MDD4338356.1 hypothetical protein [Syntrophales bacterium]HOG08436.1 hypothetical protein [Syntrophales bacterium]HOS78232.1 hypothetical protein [Syntrophales bacterium]HPB69909.1 hypothetical protein [Syntrophales bacterium]
MENMQDSGRWRNAVGMLGLGVLCLVLAGCAVFGRDKNFHPYDPAALTQIVPGKSTADDVTRLFGPPTQVVKLTGGNAYVYSRSLSKGTGLWLVFVTLVNYDTQYDQVVFFLNPQNVVTHCGSALRSGDAAYGLPF